MSDRLLVSVAGAVVEIDDSALGPHTRAQIREAWGRNMCSVEREPDLVVVAQAADDTETELALLSKNVTDALLERHCGDLWLLRAAAVANGSGNVVVLVSASGDNTQLVSALEHLTERFACVSTEAVGIDQQAGVVLTCALPLVARSEALPVPSTLRLSKIVLLDGDEAYPLDPELEHLDIGASLDLLAPLSPFFAHLPAALRTVDSILGASRSVVRVKYRNPEMLVPVIEGLMLAQPVSATPSLRPRPTRMSSEAGSGTDPLYRGATADSLILSDGRVAVLEARDSDGGLRILDEVLSAVWLAADGLPQNALRDVVLHHFGERRGGADEKALDEAIATLRADGLLSGDPVWRLSDTAVWITQSEQTFALDASSSSTRPLALPGSAGAVWAVLSTHREISQERLISECAEMFGIEAAHIEGQVTQLLADLVHHGVVSQA